MEGKAQRGKRGERGGLDSGPSHESPPGKSGQTTSLNFFHHISAPNAPSQNLNRGSAWAEQGP
eukprot:1162098-Pelagomonas_calceolata.AAC.5